MKYLDFINYYTDLTEKERNEFHAQYLNEEGDMMGLALLLRQKSIQQGLKQGMQQGEVPKPIRNKINHVDPETLLKWSDKIINSETLESIFQ